MPNFKNPFRFIIIRLLKNKTNYVVDITIIFSL